MGEQRPILAVALIVVKTGRCKSILREIREGAVGAASKMPSICLACWIDGLDSIVPRFFIKQPTHEKAFC